MPIGTQMQFILSIKSQSQFIHRRTEEKNGKVLSERIEQPAPITIRTYWKVIYMYENFSKVFGRSEEISNYQRPCWTWPNRKALLCPPHRLLMSHARTLQPTQATHTHTHSQTNHHHLCFSSIFRSPTFRKWKKRKNGKAILIFHIVLGKWNLHSDCLVQEHVARYKRALRSAKCRPIKREYQSTWRWNQRN